MHVTRDVFRGDSQLLNRGFRLHEPEHTTAVALVHQERLSQLSRSLRVPSHHSPAV
jgi:hypothetical protein